jgi:soluble cytochrome b562
MSDIRDQIEQQRGWLERLAQRVPGFRGYYDSENRREADKQVRDWGVARLDALVSHLHDATKAAELGDMDRYQELVNQVEKLRNEMRHADRGYSGFFDEIKWDDPALLDAIYERDQALVERIETTLEAGAAGAAVDELRTEIREISQALRDREHAILGLGGRH